jgi:outer membrane protein, adhesin transport system
MTGIPRAWIVFVGICAASSTLQAKEFLPELIQAALVHHPAVRAQSGLGEAAQAGVEVAKWQYWPTPSVGVEQAGTNDPSYRGDKTVTILRLQQPLWTGGRLDGNLSKAEARAIAAQADLEATRQQLALRVIQAWSDAAAAQGKLAAYEQSRDVHARLLALVERRTREGASAQADIDLARSRLDGIEADLAAAQAQRDTALDRLRLLTGQTVPVNALSQAAHASPPELLIELDILLNAAREHSPQIAKARAQARIAAADIDISKAALSPEVYLRVERQYGNFSLPGQAAQNRVFIGFTTAFGGGLSALSGIDAVQAQYRAAKEEIQAQQLAIDEQVQGDATLYRNAAVRRASLERVVQSSVDVTASWERQFLAGRKQWQDLMNATREKTQTDTQLADAFSAQQLAGWRLVILTRGVDAVLALPDQKNTPIQP